MKYSVVVSKMMFARKLVARSPLLLAPGLLVASPAQAQEDAGYHKDLFVDCGRHLLCPTPHAAKHLDLQYEILRPSSTAEQNKHIIGYPQDENGVLLYPDGAPRYRSIYVNGGESKDHGKTLGAKGLARFRNFYLRGGSYTGSCAGAFIASGRRMGKDMQDLYFSIWPGETRETWFGDKASSWYIGPSAFTIEKDSPLLKYNDFGNDLYVDQIKHYEGPYALEGEHWPEKTQVLARFDLPKARFHNTPAIWAYQKDQSSGRMVVVASHPENYKSGERMDLMAAILSYALDGNAKPKLKGLLVPGKTVNMNKASADNDPCLTKIGDGQLHHFALKVPEGAQDVTIELRGEETLSSGEPAQLQLFAQPKGAAWPKDAAHKGQASGSSQTLNISEPEAGVWFVSVLGASRVSEAQETSALSYKKNLGALNGIAYELSLSIDGARQFEYAEQQPDPWCNRWLDEVQDLPDPKDSSDSSKSSSTEPSPSSSDQSKKGTQSEAESATESSNGETSSPSTNPSPGPESANQKSDKDENQTDPAGCQLGGHEGSPWGLIVGMTLALRARSRQREKSSDRCTK